MDRRQLSRRAAFAVLGSAAAAVAAACGDSPTAPTDTSTSGTIPTSTNSSCAVTPSETVGPYPSRTDMFRSDVRENRAGTILTLTLKVVNTNSACAAVSGADVEIWQCDAAGDYSQYGSQTAATFLRGIQTTNPAGEVTFTTIYPGWYQGRATHIHVEVTMSGRSVKATQIAFPDAINNTVHTQGSARDRITRGCRFARAQGASGGVLGLGGGVGVGGGPPGGFRWTMR